MGFLRLASSSLETKLIYFYILSFVIILHSFLLNGVSAFLIGSICMMSIRLFMTLHIIHFNKIVLYGFIFLLTVYISSFYNSGSFRLSNVLFTTFYVCSVLYFRCRGTKVLSIIDFKALIYLIVRLYFVVLIIQQLQTVLGFTNVINLQTDYSSTFKLNSLAWESSNIPLIFIVLSYCYIKIDEHLFSYQKNFKVFYSRNRLFCFYVIYICFTSGSMSSFITLPILFLYYLSPKQIVNLLSIGMLLGGIVAMVSYFNIFNVTRITDLIMALGTFDKEILVAVDPSAAARIVPYFEYLSSFSSLNVHSFLGYGLDSAEIRANRIVYAYTAAGLDVDDLKMGITNITSFFYDYGLFSTLSYLFLIKALAFKKFKSFEFFLYITIFSAYSLNHYITWLFINCFSYLKVKRIL